MRFEDGQIWIKATRWELTCPRLDYMNPRCSRYKKAGHSPLATGPLGSHRTQSMNSKLRLFLQTKHHHDEENNKLRIRFSININASARALSHNTPAAQSVHDPAPSSSLYFPGSHPSHFSAAVPDVKPMGQLEHSVATPSL